MKKPEFASIKKNYLFSNEVKTIKKIKNKLKINKK
jgi:hypothetical protein